MNVEIEICKFSFGYFCFVICTHNAHRTLRWTQYIIISKDLLKKEKSQICKWGRGEEWYWNVWPHSIPLLLFVSLINKIMAIMTAKKYSVCFGCVKTLEYEHFVAQSIFLRNWTNECVCVRLLDANHFNNRNHVALANELKILEGELVIRKFAVLGKTEKKDQNTKWHFE